MGRKLKSKKKGGKGHKRAPHDAVMPSSSWNFLASAGPGCHIARMDDADDWVLEWEGVDADDFDNDVPDLAVDPEEHTLSLCNVDAYYKVAFISVFDCVLRGRDGKVLPPGTTTESSSPEESHTLKSCTTLIVLCPPYTFCHLCYLPETISPASLQLESDVQEWRQHPDPTDTHGQTIGFPLATDTRHPQYLCTQGVGGYLTHFFAGNLHAIDFQCPVGTPLLAVGSGTVVSVKVNSTVSGIAMSNLFSWNSIVLQIDPDETKCFHVDEANSFNGSLDEVSRNEMTVRQGPLFVEYVHIQSATVAVGDAVTEGQVIGTSGSVGFSPEPHLHLAVYRSALDTAPTCRVVFHTRDDTTAPRMHSPIANETRDERKLFLPQAGQWYNQSGLVVP